MRVILWGLRSWFLYMRVQSLPDDMLAWYCWVSCSILTALCNDADPGFCIAHELRVMVTITAITAVLDFRLSVIQSATAYRSRACSSEGCLGFSILTNRFAPLNKSNAEGVLQILFIFFFIFVRFVGAALCGCPVNKLFLKVAPAFRHVCRGFCF